MHQKFTLYSLLLATLLLGPFFSLSAQVNCVSNGNLFVYTNYDGGVLNLNVDVNIPNIKIGVCTYEPVTINISGAFASNVTEVRYAGYVSTNNHHCSNSATTTTITGVPSNITSVLFLPPSTLSNPNGYSSIVCAYSCSTTSNQGGCNTADQIKDYFQQSTGGQLTSYFTQYGCFSSNAYALSAGGNCCNTVVPCAISVNAGQDQDMCPNGQVTLAGSATGGATTYAWTPSTGLSNPNSASTTAAPSVTTTYILTATDGGICSAQDTVVVTVHQPTASIGQFAPMCLNAAPLSLTSGQPSGGTYSGPGVNAGDFDPSLAGVGTSTITYSVTDSYGCIATASNTILVQPLPVVTAGPFGPFCENDPSFVLPSGSPAGGAYAGAGVINGSFFPNLLTAGNYPIYYDYTDQNGCSNRATVNIDINAAPPAPTLSFANYLLTNTISDSVEWLLFNQHYTWGGDSLLSQTWGYYAAIVWLNGCHSDTSAEILLPIVGIDQGQIWPSVHVYPNPAHNLLYVDVADAAFEVAIFDPLGRLVLRSSILQSRSQISLEGLGKGIYFVQVRGEFGIETKRILIE